MVHGKRIPNIVLGASLLAVAQAPGAITLDESQRARIDELFAGFNSTTPGCSLGIMSDGQTIFSRGYGMASIEGKAPNDASKLFDIASMSKQFAAAHVVLLAQQGKLQLTDDVQKYIPELPDYGSRITINNLLWHTSGLRDYNGLLLLAGFDYFEITTQAQALELVARQKRLNFTPGTRYEYSNTGYLLLAIIAERVSGKPINQLAREQFFNPLGMPLSMYRVAHDQVIPNQAIGYGYPNDDGAYDNVISNWEQVGDGGLQTSIEEFQRWDENFYTGAVGGSAFISEMYRRGKLSSGRQLIYARGVQRDRYRGLNRVRHGGDWSGYHGQFQRYPELHTTFALFCNTDDVDQYSLARGVVDVALEGYFTQPAPSTPTPAPSLPIERFVGKYYNSNKEELYSVIADGASLKLRFLISEFSLISTGPTTFVIDELPGSEVKFDVQNGRPAHSMSFQLYSDEPDEDPRKGARTVTVAPPDDLQQYTGTYYSRELGVSWSFVLGEDGALTVAEDPEQIVLPFVGPLQPAIVTDQFFGQPGLLQFTRNGAGAISGVKLDFLGMKDFEFERRAVAATLPAKVQTTQKEATRVTLPVGPRRLAVHQPEAKH
ncbi:serine hydrolase domain-containing protein [Peristeroidobacter agariperforans]|uniref:serine hydrolase domain-containing protein n=1 Tax=Peristeroidobacter agariperforans TaxID=268404 RepID=UPI00101D8AA2|nr:serine hydrolase [Peristeroidobacter agariperforans]